ncbi:hypothetical protein LOAG_07958 [Loa loa]|uniref:Uncharacterized protein n=1 Tax=Loa loa TaxID=7209 RepID=A0A1S0TWA2_LOALO|nr:hypothetical protein LOAG_07958 [Loa loa]EFO20532.1 hypothetical protein LOAG_07958 [Loa loa]
MTIGLLNPMDYSHPASLLSLLQRHTFRYRAVTFFGLLLDQFLILVWNFISLLLIKHNYRAWSLYCYWIDLNQSISRQIKEQYGRIFKKFGSASSGIDWEKLSLKSFIKGRTISAESLSQIC